MAKRGLILLTISILAAVVLYNSHSASASLTVIPGTDLPVEATAVTSALTIPAVKLDDSASEETPDTREQVAREIRALTQGLTATYLSSEGWLHTETLYTNDSDFSRGTLPNGQSLSGSGTTEQWLQMAADGRVIQAISLVFDEQGNVTQRTIFQNDRFHDLTLDQTFSATSPYARLDSGFAELVLRSHEWGSQITRLEQADEAGRNIVIYGVKDSYASPQTLQGINEPVVGGETRAAFDRANGNLLWTATLAITQDGIEIVISQTDIVTFEYVTTPPQEALSLLE